MGKYLYEKMLADTADRVQMHRLILLVLLLTVTNLILCGAICFRGEMVRTVVLAPDATTAYTATGDRVSPNLLERFSVQAVDLLLNMTPATAGHQVETFLKNVAPESYGEISSQLRSGAEQLKKTQASSAFFAHAVSVNQDSGEVCVRGERKTLIGRTVTQSTDALFCLQTVVRNGRIWIAAVNQTPATNFQRNDK